MTRASSPADRAEPVGRQSPRSKTRGARRAADGGYPGEHRLEVERLPGRVATRCPRLEGQADLLPVGTESLRVDGDAGEPPVGLAVVGDRHELDARHALERRR